jgi:ribonuclease P protein component
MHVVPRAAENLALKALRRWLSLQKRADFLQIQAEGARAFSHRLVVQYRAGSENTHIGLTVSRKVGNAVVRNRVKRRLRAIVDALPTLPTGALVIIAKPQAATIDFATLEQDVRYCLKKLPSSPPPSALR